MFLPWATLHAMLRTLWVWTSDTQQYCPNDNITHTHTYTHNRAYWLAKRTRVFLYPYLVNWSCVWRRRAKRRVFRVHPEAYTHTHSEWMTLHDRMCMLVSAHAQSQIESDIILHRFSSIRRGESHTAHADVARAHSQVILCIRAIRVFRLGTAYEYTHTYSAQWGHTTHCYICTHTCCVRPAAPS